MAMLNNQMVQYIKVMNKMDDLGVPPNLKPLKPPICRDGDHECSKVKSCFSHDLGMLKIWGSSFWWSITWTPNERIPKWMDPMIQ